MNVQNKNELAAPFKIAILILELQEQANTRFAPTMARKPALDVGANLCVRPKILKYFFSAEN